MNRRLVKTGVVTSTIAGLLSVTVGLVLLAPLACSSPDGLEKVAEQHGFIGSAKTLLGGLLPDYSVPGMGEGSISVIGSGLIGAGIVFVMAAGLGMLLRKKEKGS